MSRAARRRHQVDASQSGLMLVLGRSMLDCNSAFAVRAHRENQVVAVRIRTLPPLSAVGDSKFGFSFQLPSCFSDPGLCLSKTCSVVIYRAQIDSR